MYAIAIVRYRSPLEKVLQHVDEHSGALLLHVPNDNDLTAHLTLDRIRDNDPFVKAGVAQYELLPWAPVIGKKRLDSLQKEK